MNNESDFPDLAKACRKLDDHERRLNSLENRTRIDSLSKFISNLPDGSGAVFGFLILLIIPGLILIFYLGHLGIIHP